MSLGRRGRRWVGGLVGLGGLSAVLTWGLLGHVPVVIVQAPVPLDIAPPLHAVDAPVTGQVRVASMVSGQHVQAGELLLELDATEPQLQSAEERQRLQALEAQQTARQQERNAAEAAWQATEQGAKTALDEARARHQEASTAVQTAQDKAQRFGPLALLAEQPQLKTAVDTTRLALQRLEHEQRVRTLEWRARQAQYQRELVTLDGEVALATARLRRLEHVLAQHRLHAPIAGRLRVVASVTPGAVVRQGDRLGVIVPPGPLLLTAMIAPAVARDRLRPGQTARLHATLGTVAVSDGLDATVEAVAEAASETGRRVVFRLAPTALLWLPFPSAATGSVTIEVERVAPLTHLLRTLALR